MNLETSFIATIIGMARFIQFKNHSTLIYTLVDSILCLVLLIVNFVTTLISIKFCRQF